MYARQLGASIELAQHELPHLAVDIFERRDLFIVDVPLVRIRRIPHFDLLLRCHFLAWRSRTGFLEKAHFP
jgi:hypothetical protein